MTDVSVSPNPIDVIIEILLSLRGTDVKYLTCLGQQRSDVTTDIHIFAVAEDRASVFCTTGLFQTADRKDG